MSMFSKIKNVLFTEEEVTEEIPMITKEEVKSVPKYEEKEIEEEREIPRFKNYNYESVEEVKKEEAKETKIPEPVVEPRKEEKSPFQSFDEEEFERIAAINKNRLLERDRRAREEKERSIRLQSSPIKNEIKQHVEEEHKFKPTPVISPVYGILDKNYTKDDILPRASSDGTLPKIMDVDEVRQKAFGTLEDLEKNIKDETLEDVKITSFADEIDSSDDNIVLDSNGDIQTIAKTEEDVEETEEVNTKELPTIEEEVEEVELPELNIDDFTEKEKEIKEEVKKEDEQIENDLFDLIDSMYQEDGE